MGDTMTGEQFLAHYGVKGMHWGIRSDRNGLSGLSDDELKARLTRIRMETEYKKLSGGNRSVTSGLKSVKNNMAAAAAITTTAAALTPHIVNVGQKLLESHLTNVMAS